MMFYILFLIMDYTNLKYAFFKYKNALNLKRKIILCSNFNIIYSEHEYHNIFHRLLMFRMNLPL